MVIVAEDTDVLTLAIHHCDKIHADLFQKIGKARVQYVDIGNVVRALGNDIALGILGLHSFTGCDTVSSFAGRGKVSALKLLKGSTEYQKLFGRLGAEWTEL